MNSQISISRRSVCLGLTTAGVLGSSGALLTSGTEKQATPANPIVSNAVARAKALLAALDEKQTRRVKLEFDDERRQTWHFVPMPARKGLELRAIDDVQFALAIELLKSVVSDSGFKRATDTMSYEDILLQVEGAHRADVRDYKKYNYTIFGEPSETGDWGLSVEGHHLSLNFTFSEGQIVDSTPQFFGVNPASVDKKYSVPSVIELGTKFDVEKGVRLLGQEEDAGFDLLHALDDEQLKVALIDTNCPDDILWGGVPQPKKIEAVGLAASKLNEPQKTLLVQLINALQCALPESVALGRLALIEKAGLDQVHFAWAGATTKDKQHYYRVQGPTFIAEYCNYQADSVGNIPNHIHCVWRDLTGDFNVDLTA